MRDDVVVLGHPLGSVFHPNRVRSSIRCRKSRSARAAGKARLMRPVLEEAPRPAVRRAMPARTRRAGSTAQVRTARHDVDRVDLQRAHPPHRREHVGICAPAAWPADPILAPRVSRPARRAAGRRIIPCSAYPSADHTPRTFSSIPPGFLLARRPPERHVLAPDRVLHDRDVPDLTVEEDDHRLVDALAGRAEHALVGLGGALYPQIEGGLAVGVLTDHGPYRLDRG